VQREPLALLDGSWCLRKQNSARRKRVRWSSGESLRLTFRIYIATKTLVRSKQSSKFISDMPLPSDRDEIIVLLARAFDRAWTGYFRPGRLVTVPQDVARKALATLLAKLAKEGMCDEDSLAESGMQHLLSITPEPWGHVSMERASGKFVRLWRVRIDRVGW
jgi:hypothetical protein